MAYKVFTNGSPLPASDLNTYLMNQSVISFANATARDATLTSPTEGMVVYLEDTNRLQVYTGSGWETQNPMTTAGDLIVGGASGTPGRLGIGTNGQVLSSNGTTATWSTPSTGGWTLLSTTTWNTQNLSIGSIDQSYKNLRVEIIASQNSNATFKSWNYNSSVTLDYVFRAGTAWTQTNNGSPFWANNATIDAGSSGNYYLDIWNYASTTELKPFLFTGISTVSSNKRHDWMVGTTTTTAAISTLNFNNSASGTISGTVRIYGGN